MRNIFSGRYGLDNLGKILIGIWIIFAFLGNIFRSNILISIGTIFIIYALYRMTSRNTYKRYCENKKAEDFLKKRRLLHSQYLARKNDKRNNYFKCPNCKKYMSVPKGVGKVAIVCAYCKNQFIKTSK